MHVNPEKNNGVHDPAAMGQCEKYPAGKFPGIDPVITSYSIHYTKLYDNFSHYGLNPETETIDLNQVEDLARANKPKMIVAGASAYPRIIDFKGFSEIAKACGALFLVDMAHIAGLVAAGVHPTPVGYADIITSTTHKTLRGPRGGLILSGAEWGKKINSQIFPGIV